MMRAAKNAAGTRLLGATSMALAVTCLTGEVVADQNEESPERTRVTVAQALTGGSPGAAVPAASGAQGAAAVPPSSDVKVGASQAAAPGAAPAAPGSGTNSAGKPALRAYGIVRPAIIVANGLESFGFATFGAPTAAVNPVFNPSAKDIGLSYQIMQTRFGAVIGEGYPARATVEVDFLHLDQSSPTVAAYPRVRQAFAEWHPDEGHKVVVGQAWDLFAPLNTHTYNLVANNFLAGNSGFIRQQLSYLRTSGSYEAGLSLGLQGANNGAALSNVEYSLMPTVAARAGVRSGSAASLLVSAIGTRLRFDEVGKPDSYRLAMGAAVSGELTQGRFNLRAETYAGSNLANIGLLTLGQGWAGGSVREAGGWLSTKYGFTGVHAVYLVAGGAQILDDERARVGYTPAGMDKAAARVAANGPGITRNLVGRIGYVATPGAGFSFLLEPFMMLTRHKLHSTDLEAGTEGARVGYGIEAGGLYQF
jgi:hypothetical protein